MKILISSDWHLDAITAGVPRVAELDGYLDALEVAIKMQGIRAAILCGDFFNPGGMRAHELTAVLFRALHRLSALVDDLIVLAGNHDVVESSEGWTVLSPMVAAAGFTESTCDFFVAERPAFRILGWDSSHPVGVLALPYVARAAERPENLRQAIEDAVAYDEGPVIVAGHMTVPGALLGSESKELARGRDLDLPLETLAALKPRFVFNGHYHRAQVVPGPVPVVIPGSPWRITFGEAGDAHKGFLVVEV